MSLPPPSRLLSPLLRACCCVRAPLQRQRVGIMRWVDTASGEARDAMLSEVAGVSLRRGRIAFRNWEPSSRPAIKCVRVIESAHPYLPSTDMEVGDWATG